MVLKLPNELIEQMAHFILYKPLDPGDYWSIDENKIPVHGPIISSFVLSFYIANKWRKIKKKRKEMLINIVNKIEKIRKDDDQPNMKIHYFDQKMSLFIDTPNCKIYHLHFWERKIGWYWDEPKENENVLCALCLKWENYEKEKFERCPNSIHLFHKECYSKFIEFCFGHDWPECHLCHPFWYDNIFSLEYI